MFIFLQWNENSQNKVSAFFLPFYQFPPSVLKNLIRFSAFRFFTFWPFGRFRFFPLFFAFGHPAVFAFFRFFPHNANQTETLLTLSETQ